MRCGGESKLKSTRSYERDLFVLLRLPQGYKSLNPPALTSGIIRRLPTQIKSSMLKSTRSYERDLIGTFSPETAASLNPPALTSGISTKISQGGTRDA